MIVYKNYFSFIIDNQEINVYSDETDYGLSSVADINNVHYYLGDQFPDLDMIILAWQDLNDKNLSEEEILKIKDLNKFYAGTQTC